MKNPKQTQKQEKQTEAQPAEKGGYRLHQAQQSSRSATFKTTQTVLHKKQTAHYFLRASHCSTFGQTKHSSGKGASPGLALNPPLKCAHFAGDSKTFDGYSAARTSTTRISSVTISILLMQKGHAK
jgi:hypothetical protein